MKRKFDRNDLLQVERPQAAQFPLVDDLWCIQVKVPADLEYVYLLQGFVGFLTNYWTYKGTLEERKAVADLWLIAYTATQWDGCMDCTELQECLEPLFANQALLFKAMLNTSLYGTDVTPGSPMSAEQRNADLTANTNPTCDLDVTWAQSSQVIANFDSLIRAALANAETATNDTELINQILDLPGLQELPINAIAGYAAMLQDAIAENYEAQADATYLEETSCALFCEARDDCQITTQMIYDLFYGRVTDYFGAPVEAIVTVSDLMGYLVDQDIDGTIVADTIMLVVAGGGMLAQVFLGEVGTKPLEVLLDLAVNDANSDWELLCTECSTCDTQYSYTNEASFTPIATNDAALDPTGWYTSGAYPAGAPNPQWVLLESAETPTGITQIKLRVDISDNDAINMGFVIDTGGGVSTVPATGFTDNGNVRTYFLDFMTPEDLSYLGFNVNSAVDIVFRVISASLCD